MYTLIRLQESTLPTVIKLPVLLLQPCTPGHSPGSSLCLSCVQDLAHTQLCLCFASPILTKPNAICSCLCFKSPARNKEKSKYLCWAVTLSIQAINDRLQQSLCMLCGISTVLAPASQPHQDGTPTIKSWVLTWGKMTECDWNMALKKKPQKQTPKTKTKTHKQTNHKKTWEKSSDPPCVRWEEPGLCVQFHAEQHFHSGSSVGNFCPSACNTSCQSALKYFRAAFLCKVPSLKPCGGLIFLGTELLFVWADQGDEDVCYQINSWTSDLCFWEAAGLQCLVNPGSWSGVSGPVQN